MKGPRERMDNMSEQQYGGKSSDQMRADIESHQFRARMRAVSSTVEEAAQRLTTAFAAIRLRSAGGRVLPRSDDGSVVALLSPGRSITDPDEAEALGLTAGACHMRDNAPRSPNPIAGGTEEDSDG